MLIHEIDDGWIKTILTDDKIMYTHYVLIGILLYTNVVKSVFFAVNLVKILDR